MPEKTLTICYTTDLHGHFYPTTYGDKAEAPIGLFRCVPRFDRGENVLIIDGGDTLQGSPFATYCQKELHAPDTVAEIMNLCGYDIVTLGNHDFNYGMPYLDAYLAHGRFACVCENLHDGAGGPRYPYLIRTMPNGLRVGVVGVVTDYVNVWEKPENLSGVRITDPFAAAREALEAMRGQADLTVCIYHGGFERDLDTGRLLSGSGENIAYRLCRELDFDLLLTGHQHLSLPGRMLHGTYTLQGAANGIEFHRITVAVGEDGGKRISSERIAASAPADVALQMTFSDVESAVQAWLDESVGSLPHALRRAPHLEMAAHGSDIARLFLDVQMEATGAQISAVSLANDVLGFASSVTRRDILASYPYSNTLVVLEITGAKLRAALERSAAYFALDASGALTVSEAFLLPKVEHYNYDYYGGIAYRFDVSRPVGERVVFLQYEGRDVRPDERFSICVSNYRASGAGGYDMYPGCRVLREVQQDMSDLILDYFERGLQQTLFSRMPFRFEVTGGR
jgi:2',3'-cyclic-nucleotide 2'-phosphodiesterase/3'-nucleotidase